MTGPHRAAVLGAPIKHSLSPALHRAAYAYLGLQDWVYDPFEVTQASLPGFVGDLGDRWAGLSLTMPLKRAVLPLLTERSSTVVETGVANTVVLHDGRRLGHNTDVAGLVNALSEHGVVSVARPVVLGGGATASSALVAVHRLGAVEVTVCVRRPDAARPLQELAGRLGLRLALLSWDGAAGVHAVASSDLVLATSPAGSTDELAGALTAIPPGTTLFDVIYAPWPTALAAAWQRGGGGVVGGLDLLVHQAALQVALMVAPVTGNEIDAAELVAPMREAGCLGLRTQASPPD